MTWVNLLRMQFIEILEFYDMNPEQFQYKELKKAYDALLSVKSVEEFKQWRKLLKDYGLSFTDMDGTANKDNQLRWRNGTASSWTFCSRPPSARRTCTSSSSLAASRMRSVGRPSGRMPTAFSRSSDGRQGMSMRPQDR